MTHANNILISLFFPWSLIMAPPGRGIRGPIKLVSPRRSLLDNLLLDDPLQADRLLEDILLDVPLLSGGSSFCSWIVLSWMSPSWTGISGVFS